MDPKHAYILLVEDDRILTDMYRIKFEVSDLHLSVAYGGYDGLALAKKEKADLILLDTKMDDLDSLEVLKRLKADPPLRPVPVILLSNMNERENKDRDLALGAEGYILKSKTLPSDIVNRAVARLNQL